MWRRAILEGSINCEVGNGMFQRMWKNHDDSEESYDDDTLPIIRKHQNSSQIEAQSLSLVVNMLVKKKEKAKGKWLPVSHKVQQ